MRILAATALALSTIATPALAQDGDTAGDANFGGVKIGVVAGSDQARSDDDIKGNGVVYGGTVGYDIQSGKLVFGAEVEGTYSNADGCSQFLTDICVKAKRDLYAGGRLGVVVGDNFLVYGKVGYTNARLSARDAFLNVDLGSANFDGLRVGGGVEAVADSGILGRLEYRYSNYEADTRRHQIVAVLGYRF